MSEEYTNEPMLDMFLFETTQLIEQLEQSILASEKTSCFTPDAINEIFRIMHTIKGSSAMMMFDGISTIAHSIEDIFYYLREKKPNHVDCSALSDLVLEGADFIKDEVDKIKNGNDADGNAAKLLDSIKGYLSDLKRNNPSVESTKARKRNAFKAVVYFEEGCQMENIRAYSITHNLKDITDEFSHIPENIIDDDSSADVIRRDGFKIYFKTDCSYEKMHEFFMQTIFLKDLELKQLDNDEELKQLHGTEQVVTEKKISQRVQSENITQQSIISVSVAKLDKLMDLVGEMVISEAMVVQNPDLKGLELDNFQRAARQLHKITSELQDIVMSIRMVPLSATFLKMHRIVRDMCKRLGKEVELKIIGEETEVDKNVIEHISDPLIHLVRNALDHGIESPAERLAKGKPETGTITLEAKNAGSDVLVIVKDDGKGLNKENIIKKAKENGLLYKSQEEMSDNEIYNLIFLPGFSTNEGVTEFSGRGVGMDVVIKNIETIGGAVSVGSIPDMGSTITMKIPLTLAIIDGMNTKVGSSCYTIPTTNIRESFNPNENDIFTDPEDNEMIMVRGKCYPVLRLHELFKVNTDITSFSDGIIIMAEQDDKTICIFVDELLGQQQVVVKALPEYIRGFKKTKALAGCTLLGDGSISLILDIAGLVGFRE
jgi:two-component system chemotaxis sensor kinase CheA